MKPAFVPILQRVTICINKINFRLTSFPEKKKTKSDASIIKFTNLFQII